MTGPDRFYQQHLIIPGEIDISGVTIMGVPVVLIGFNDRLAWSHTVNVARRFGLYELALVEGKPTRYLYDGRERELEATVVTVPLPGGGSATRTLYRSHHGVMVDLSGINPALGWSGTRAYAMRDANLENWNSMAGFLAWNHASSLQEFIDIQKAMAAQPWVNTAAVGRDDARAYYSAITAVPNVPDDLLAACAASPYGTALNRRLPGLPVLDGSRSECEWRTDPDSSRPGTFGASKLPSLERTDYVANMNDSHWLSNPAQPLTGFPAVVGNNRAAEPPPGAVPPQFIVPPGDKWEIRPQGLRTRMGHVLVRDRLTGADGLPGNRATSETIREIVLNSRSFSAELLKDDLVAACDGTPVRVGRDAASGETFDPALEIDVSEACAVLAGWDGTGGLDARGALVWNEFWRRTDPLYPFARAFDPDDPIGTPAVLDTRRPEVLEAFGAAVHHIRTKLELPLDAAVRDYQFFPKAGTRIPVYGGYLWAGYFTGMNPESLGVGSNAYMHVVDFPENAPVRAYVMLSHSQSSDPASPHYSDYTQAYADKAWHRMPYTAAEIAAQRISSLRLEE